MKTTLLREIPIILLVFAPFVYLFVIWNQLPDTLPMQYDFEGNVARYGSKNELMLVAFLLAPLMYVIMLVLPKIDPKGKISKMGQKFQRLKFVLVLFMSALATYMIYFSARGGTAPPNGVITLLGLFFAVLGNYFQSIQPNYFIGIRTPWTLENEEVWRATHRLAGWIWLAGGLIVAILSLLVDAKIAMPVFVSAIGVMVIVPIVYSDIKFREIKNANQQ